MAKVLLVEDEVNIASFIQRGLNEYGHEVEVAYDGNDGWEKVKNNHFDLLVLDVIMPKIDGLELCRMFRENFGYQVPIIMLTALGTTEDIVKGLDAGADDYVVKPFSFQELQARIKALLRRNISTANVTELQCGDMILNCYTRKAVRSGREVQFTAKEYKLIEYLMLHQGEAIDRQTLLKNVWNIDFDPNTNVVDVYVNYLRVKIDKGFSHKLIHTVVGVGYMMNA